METAEDCQSKNFGKNYQLKKNYQSKKKKNMGPYKLLQPPRRWSCPHEPTSIMANAQRKMKKNMKAWLPHCGYPILTANLPNPTC